MTVTPKHHLITLVHLRSHVDLSVVRSSNNKKQGLKISKKKKKKDTRSCSGLPAQIWVLQGPSRPGRANGGAGLRRNFRESRERRRAAGCWRRRCQPAAAWPVGLSGHVSGLAGPGVAWYALLSCLVSGRGGAGGMGLLHACGGGGAPPARFRCYCSIIWRSSPVSFASCWCSQ